MSVVSLLGAPATMPGPQVFCPLFAALLSAFSNSCDSQEADLPVILPFASGSSLCKSSIPLIQTDLNASAFPETGTYSRHPPATHSRRRLCSGRSVRLSGWLVAIGLRSWPAVTCHD